MVAKLTNNASSTLAGAINTSVTSIAIASGDASKFPTLSAGEWFPLTVVDSSGNMEIMRVTARSGATLTVVRGQEGTTARAFAAGSKCDLRLTAAAAVAPALATDATAVTQAAGNNSKAVANTEFVQSAINAIKNGVSTAFDTLSEIAAELGSINTALGNRIRVDASQSFTDPQKTQARDNIGFTPALVAYNKWKTIVDQEFGGVGQLIRTGLGDIRRMHIEGSFRATGTPQGLVMEVSADNGLNYYVGPTDYQTFFSGRTAGSGLSGDAFVNAAILSNAVSSGSSVYASEFFLTLSDFNEAIEKYMGGTNTYVSVAPATTSLLTGNRILPAVPLNALRIRPSGGTVMNGYLHIEGIPE